MKKLTAIIITALILFSVLSFACAAYSDESATAQEQIYTTDETLTNNEETTANEQNQSGEFITDITETDSKETKNPFEAVFNKVKEHSDTIFSALTLIGSLVLAFTYKKGLLPALGASIGKIGDTVKKIGDATEMSIIKGEGAIIDIDERIRQIGELFERLEEQLEDLNQKMEAVEGERQQSERTRILMRSQVDMLYDIFMTSSLPQYSKDAVGEKIAAMKSLLEEGEG